MTTTKKPKVIVTVDSEWLDRILTRVVEAALKESVGYRLEQQLEREITQAVERAMQFELARAAKATIKAQLAGIK